MSKKCLKPLFRVFARCCTKPIGRFQRSIGHTGPLIGAKSHAQVAAFCRLIKGRRNGSPRQISFPAVLKAGFHRLFCLSTVFQISFTLQWPFFQCGNLPGTPQNLGHLLLGQIPGKYRKTSTVCSRWGNKPWLPAEPEAPLSSSHREPGKHPSTETVLSPFCIEDRAL